MIPNTIFAAIDIETTGLDVELHEILDIAIVPLNEDFTISATMPEFTARVRAEHPETATVEALRVNGLNPAEGKNKKEVADEFRQWLFDCGIEKIIPIAHNLDFDMRFIFRAFPAESKVFSRHGRDRRGICAACGQSAGSGYAGVRYAGCRVTLLHLCLHAALHHACLRREPGTTVRA